MTLTQFFFHLEQNKKIVVETETKDLFFFEKNEDPETKQDFSYVGVAQDGLKEPEYFAFTKDKLLKLLETHPNILKSSFIGEIETVEGRPNILQKIKFFFLGRL